MEKQSTSVKQTQTLSYHFLKNFSTVFYKEDFSILIEKDVKENTSLY